MKMTLCKLRNCPRLVWAKAGIGRKDFAQCNQQMPDGSIWWEDVENIDSHWCKTLRDELKKKREVQI